MKRKISGRNNPSCYEAGIPGFKRVDLLSLVNKTWH